MTFGAVCRASMRAVMRNYLSSLPGQMKRANFHGTNLHRNSFTLSMVMATDLVASIKHCMTVRAFALFCITAFLRDVCYIHSCIMRTVVGHFWRNGLIFRIPSVYYARDFTRAVNLYARV